MEDERNFGEANYKRGRIISGIVLIITGSLFFARKLGMIFPDWLFSWPMFLIALGVYIGAKHNFRNPSWLILVGLGAVFMLERFYPDLSIYEYFWRNQTFNSSKLGSSERCCCCIRWNRR